MSTELSWMRSKCTVSVRFEVLTVVVVVLIGEMRLGWSAEWGRQEGIRKPLFPFIAITSQMISLGDFPERHLPGWHYLFSKNQRSTHTQRSDAQQSAALHNPMMQGCKILLSRVASTSAAFERGVLSVGRMSSTSQ
jgi:hypothetical protein